MLTVKLICVGKLKERYLKDAVEEYEKRMRPLCKFSIIELEEERLFDNPSDAMIKKAVEIESERMLSKIAKNDYVVAMCVEGKSLSSEALSETIEKLSLSHSVVDFLIGGSWGMSEALKARADVRLSMGKMIFPHQLFRVMLCEQIYRAFQIIKGTKYHK